MQENKFDSGISERFKFLREKELKLTQGQLADRLKVQQADISKMENCRKQLDAGTMKELAFVFQISINWLLTGTGPKKITDQGGNQTLDPDPEIAELMEGARKVLTSGNSIAFDALERNIRYFSHAIAAEKELQEMKEDVAGIKKEMGELKKQQCQDDTVDRKSEPKKKPLGHSGDGFREKKKHQNP